MFLVFLRNVHRVKYLRLTMIVAISVAMLVPTGIFAECCCSSGDAGCCTVTTPVEVSKTSCCSCEKALAESDSLLECATLKLGNRVRSSCECCRGIGQISTALPVRLGKVLPRSNCRGIDKLWLTGTCSNRLHSALNLLCLQ